LKKLLRSFLALLAIRFGVASIMKENGEVVMNVTTDIGVLAGHSIEHAERDNEGNLHFHSKAVFSLQEIRQSTWDHLASTHPEISSLASLENGQRARRTSEGWEIH
jgi:hypothetical protein